jgi:hypothetical protein
MTSLGLAKSSPLNLYPEGFGGPLAFVALIVGRDPDASRVASSLEHHAGGGKDGVCHRDASDFLLFRWPAGEGLASEPSKASLSKPPQRAESPKTGFRDTPKRAE